MPIYMNWGDGTPPEIRGDAKDPQHQGWIELYSFQWGVGRGIAAPTSSDADRESAKPSVSEIVVTKSSDSATAGLHRESLIGSPKDVEIHFVKTGTTNLQVYLSLKLSNCLISRYSVGGGSHEGPKETVTLNFTKIEWGPAAGVTPHTGPPPSDSAWYLAAQRGA